MIESRIWHQLTLYLIVLITQEMDTVTGILACVMDFNVDSASCIYTTSICQYCAYKFVLQPSYNGYNITISIGLVRLVIH